MIGAPPNRWLLEVGILLVLSLATLSIPFLDLPEVGPGALIGTSGSVTSSEAGLITVSQTVTSSHSSSPSKSPAPSSSGSSSSMTGTIVGSVVGGVAVIAIAIFGTFYCRWRRSRASSAPLLDPGTQTPPAPASETPMPPMRGHVSAFMPSSRLCVLMSNFPCVRRTCVIQPRFLLVLRCTGTPVPCLLCLCNYISKLADPALHVGQLGLSTHALRTCHTPLRIVFAK